MMIFFFKFLEAFFFLLPVVDQCCKSLSILMETEMYCISITWKVQWISINSTFPIVWVNSIAACLFGPASTVLKAPLLIPWFHVQFCIIDIRPPHTSLFPLSISPDTLLQPVSSCFIYLCGGDTSPVGDRYAWVLSSH